MTEQEKLAKLQGAHDLYTNALFQDWVKSLAEELEVLKELPWKLDSRSSVKCAAVLEACGLHAPKDAQGLFETFTVVRGVVHYVEGKLGQIKSQSEMYVKLLERIREREKEENYG